MSKSAKLGPEELVRKLITKVKVATESVAGKGENRTWTLAVKKALEEIGKESSPSYDCVFTDGESGVSEFMLDFIWWDRNEGEGAVLAVECEWFYGRFRREEAYAAAVSEDFWKLLVFKAPLKLIIFASMKDNHSNEDIQAKVLRKLEQCIRKYSDHVRGEIYMAIDFAPTTRAWMVEIAHPGTNENLSFKEIEI